MIPISIRAADIHRGPESQDYPMIISAIQHGMVGEVEEAFRLDEKALFPKRPYSKLNKTFTKKAAQALYTNLLQVVDCEMAVNPLDHDQAYGFVVYHKDILLWIYTKKMFRNEKIGSRLMEVAFSGKPATAIFHTAAMRHLWEKWNVKYNPVRLEEIL